MWVVKIESINPNHLKQGNENRISPIALCTVGLILIVVPRVGGVNEFLVPTSSEGTRCLGFGFRND
jgi:hypothetical protein